MLLIVRDYILVYRYDGQIQSEKSLSPGTTYQHYAYLLIIYVASSCYYASSYFYLLAS